MKRTKSMYYNPTYESRELYVYAINKQAVYDLITCIQNNLNKKINLGIYDHEKAILAFYPAADKASTLYLKDFGYKFTVNERYNAAIELLNEFEIDNDI